MVLLGTPSLQLFNIYPRLGALLQLHRPVLRKIEEVRAILKMLLETRRPPAPGAGPVQSYMDALIQQGQGKDPHGLFAEADMVACVLDMVMAGTETTSATLQWAALLMSRHPSVQGRVQEELDQVLGPGRPPRLEDQRSLPYTSAVLHEVQRSITLLPHVPRCMAADTQLGGYLLPKGTPVIPLLSSVLLDKTQWETPRQFNPGHFLDADGRFVKRAAFLPFSAGTACCPHRASALAPWTPRPPRPSPCGRQHRPSARCPDTGALPKQTRGGSESLSQDPARGALWMMEAGQMGGQPSLCPLPGSLPWPLGPHLGPIVLFRGPSPLPSSLAPSHLYPSSSRLPGAAGPPPHPPPPDPLGGSAASVCTQVPPKPQGASRSPVRCPLPAPHASWAPDASSPHPPTLHAAPIRFPSGPLLLGCGEAAGGRVTPT
ncbi:cytochrome P450 2W1 isoform X2 [Prionailurus viverrinus]|uniref:cytochrome P450 2W1 isoform X2 n=1 Tax=Prionailurus viverrinus TaxID=61388 RepID=UPI001FF5AF29|nr:cytochrome P450 2W1 isoform X2 [Prionailurus viverrinus]XP_047694735.1 cytochrome P450 2W1 isoform X2 [Prionailurus viverrinus]